MAKNRRKKRLNDEKSTTLPKFQEVLNNNKNKQSDLTVGTKTAQSISKSCPKMEPNTVEVSNLGSNETGGK